MCTGKAEDLLDDKFWSSQVLLDKKYTIGVTIFRGKKGKQTNKKDFSVKQRLHKDFSQVKI